MRRFHPFGMPLILHAGFRDELSQMTPSGQPDLKHVTLQMLYGQPRSKQVHLVQRLGHETDDCGLKKPIHGRELVEIRLINGGSVPKLL